MLAAVMTKVAQLELPDGYAVLVAVVPTRSSAEADPRRRDAAVASLPSADAAQMAKGLQSIASAMRHDPHAVSVLFERDGDGVYEVGPPPGGVSH
ncbi:MAG: hypothetical protein JWL95_3258 [Gemmatimonadetes bacterium]|nr:hypothetical protein [Gemmatimonadota bacterium]